MNELGFRFLRFGGVGWGGWRMEALLPFWAGLFPLELESIQRLCNWAAFDGHIDLLRTLKKKR
jgi:hypothetical protein